MLYCDFKDDVIGKHVVYSLCCELFSTCLGHLSVDNFLNIILKSDEWFSFF